MTIRTLVLTVVACAVRCFHDGVAHPCGHDDDEKTHPHHLRPLADKERYTDDVSYPERSKALKGTLRCEKKGPGERGQRPHTPDRRYGITEEIRVRRS